MPSAEWILAEEREVLARLAEQGDLEKSLCHLDLNVSNIAYDEESGGEGLARGSSAPL